VFILVRTPGKSSVRVVPSLASSREHATRSDVQGVPASIAALDHRANRHMSPRPVPDLLRLSRRRHDPCEWPPGLGSAQPDRMRRDRRERPRRGGRELDNWERGRRLCAAPWPPAGRRSARGRGGDDPGALGHPFRCGWLPGLLPNHRCRRVERSKKGCDLARSEGLDPPTF
jgi:hypothetical protein